MYSLYLELLGRNTRMFHHVATCSSRWLLSGCAHRALRHTIPWQSNEADMVVANIIWCLNQRVGGNMILSCNRETFPQNYLVHGYWIMATNTEVCDDI